VLAFFAVVIAVNTVLAVVASGSWTGLIARNGYVASQDYNGVLAEAREQRLLGWRSELEAAAEGLVFTLQDAGGRPVSGLSVAAAIARPTHEGEDRAVELEDRGGGRYVGAQKLAAGAWSVEVMAEDGSGRQYRRIFRLSVR